ncbi:MAG: sulfatase [Planctomycetes bacterium]|nr:sulfatase [Planctomycetota bacterium]
MKRDARWLWIAAPVALLVACGPRASNHGAGRGVLLISIDALRADHTGSGGYDRDTTPILDALAKQGVSFERAYASAPRMVPSHAALLTGCDATIARRILPQEVIPNQLTTWQVPDDAPSLAKEFLRHGWATSAFVDDPALATNFGFARGFTDFMACEIDEDTRPADLGVSGVSEHFEQWLKNLPRAENWFAYLHLHDLERVWSEPPSQWDTYYPPRPELADLPPVGIGDRTFFALPRSRWRGSARTLGEYEATYDGAVHKLDRQLGRLFAHLKQLGRFDDVTVCIVGAYGLSFGETGLYLDSGTLADADLHVPWILRPAKAIALEPRTFADAVGLVDVAPTLLACAGFAPPGEALQGEAMHGEPLLDVLRGTRATSRGLAFASSGYQPGWVVIDHDHCLERVRPGRALDAELVRSWFGDDRDHVDEIREVYHDRTRSPRPGHLIDALEGLDARAELSVAGEGWFQRAERARERWQARTWLGASTAATLEPKSTPPAEAK